MGNNNSTENKENTEPNVDIVKFFMGETSGNSKDRTYEKANQLYNKMNTGGNGTGNELYYERDNILEEKKIDVFTDLSRGIYLPYFSDQKASKNGNSYDPLISSENPHYIEFIICNYPMEDIKEKFAVHSSKPDHNCGANCHCIQKFVEVDGEKSKDLSKNILPSIFSPTSSEPKANSTILSATSPQFENQVGACPVCKKSFNEHQYGGNCPLSKNDKMMGGAKKEDDDNEVSPEDLTESEEESDEMFSTTSEMSDTSPSPGKEKPKKKKKEKKEKKEEGLEGLEEENEDENEEEKEDENEDENEEEKEDENEDEEFLEGIDDEELTEDGFILEQSDISSSDLYKMQNRIFHSITDSDDNDESTTEKVSRAMDVIDRRNMFDSEDKDILNIKSSSEKYMKKSARKNNKYY